LRLCTDTRPHRECSAVSVARYAWYGCGADSYVRNALELVAELEFVWNQVKDNAASSNDSSPRPGLFEPPGGRAIQPGVERPGLMKVLSPMSEEDEAEREDQQRLIDEALADDGEYVKKGGKWSRKMERAIIRLSAEVAALREHITTGREWRSRREQSLGAWAGWTLWILAKHVTIDLLVLFGILLWMRRRKDRRIEDHVRGLIGIFREYVRKVLPAR
jgi:hypothetical protein